MHSFFIIFLSITALVRNNQRDTTRRFFFFAGPRRRPKIGTYVVCTLYNSYIIISPRAKRVFFSNDVFRVVITLQGSNIFDKFDSLLSTISRKGLAFFFQSFYYATSRVYDFSLRACTVYTFRV